MRFDYCSSKAEFNLDNFPGLLSGKLHSIPITELLLNIYAKPLEISTGDKVGRNLARNDRRVGTAFFYGPD